MTEFLNMTWTTEVREVREEWTENTGIQDIFGAV